MDFRINIRNISAQTETHTHRAQRANNIFINSWSLKKVNAHYF